MLLKLYTRCVTAHIYCIDEAVDTNYKHCMMFPRYITGSCNFGMIM